MQPKAQMSERLSQNSGTEAMTTPASEEIRPRAAQQAPHGDAGASEYSARKQTGKPKNYFM